LSAKLNQHLQDCFVKLAIEDDEFLRLVHSRINPRHFTSRLTEDIISICFDYYERFREAPKNHFHDAVVRLLEDKPDDDKKEYVKYIERLIQLHQPNKSYVLNRVNDFIKVREREIALVEAADLVAEERIDEADNLLYKVLQSGIQEEDAGLDYLRNLSNVENQPEESIMIPTGMSALDRLIEGYRRGQFVVILGGYKAGKTWCLMHLARAGLLYGMNVLHISLEMSLRVMETRYDMMFSARGTRNIGERVRYKKFDRKLRKIVQRNATIKSVHDIDTIARARRRMLRFGGSLRMKKYPMGGCSPAEVERFINYLETYEGFSPDILIIDYLDIMDLGGTRRELRHQLNDSYIWAKGLADRRNILVATVSQITRSALKKRHISPKDVAEDIRKVGNVDLMLAIGRSDDDVKNNLAGMSVVANREGRQDCSCIFSPCYDIGQFCLSSWLKYDIEDEEDDDD